ncbi:META domain-containing protein, partial [Campylobacter jejuni]|nr:META domain-containing protein [Campylobacter jejuni]
MKKTLKIALAAAFFTGCASTSVTPSASKGNNELVQNQLFKIEKIIVNGKTYNPKNAEESPNIS